MSLQWAGQKPRSTKYLSLKFQCSAILQLLSAHGWGGEQGALLELCFTQDKNYEEGGGVKGYIWRELSSVVEEAAGTMKGGSFPHAAVLLELENAWVSQRCGCYLETIQYIFRRDI